VKLREAIAAKLGVDAVAADFTDGMVIAAGKRVPLGEAAARRVSSAKTRSSSRSTGEEIPALHVRRALSSKFAVDSTHRRDRVRRMLAVCSAGRILNPNPRAARSSAP
jgi:xanthine dehydrogenase YagR molybdenum-binding subunit